MRNSELGFSTAVFHTPETGIIKPDWIHVGCGGLIYGINDSEDFGCNKCLVSGRLSADIPDEVPETEVTKYILEHVKEVDLI